MTARPRPVATVPVGLLLAALLAVGAGGLVLGVVMLLGGAPAADRVAEPDVVAALGSSGDGYTVWASNDDGSPVRWDPCTPIDLVVNDAEAPEGWRADLAVALGEVGDASGIELRVTGQTDEAPHVTRDAYQPERYGERWAPVLVAWAEPGAGELPLRETDRGLAIPVAVGPPGDRTYVTGQVVLGAHRNDLRPGFADRSTSWGATLLHELGHLLGLAHADDPEQLMAPFPGEGPVAFDEGDLAGLAAVGRAAGCRDAPPPQPVEVPEPLTELDLHRSGR